MNKKRTIALLSALMLLLFSTETFAGTSYVYDMFEGKGYKVFNLYVNNKEVKTPVLYKDYKDYLPIKAIAASMGDTCVISGKTATVVKKDKTRIVFTSGSPAVKAGNKVKYLYPDYATIFERKEYYPIIANGVFYIPVNNFTRILGYEYNTDFKIIEKKGYKAANITSYYIGKAPDSFYQKTEYKFITRHDKEEIISQLTAEKSKYKLIPVQDFSRMEKITAARDPGKDFIQVSRAMPMFIYNLSKTSLSYTDSKDAAGLKKYIADLEAGTLKVDNVSYGYDSLGYYTYPFNALCAGQSKNGVSIGITGTIGRYGITDDKGNDIAVVDFNVANAVYHIIKYYMPEEGDAVFDRLMKDMEYNKPVKYPKDRCTVELTHTTGPDFLKITWDPVK